MKTPDVVDAFAPELEPVRRRKKHERQFPVPPPEESDPAAEAALAEKYKGTTPHGREIIRKRLYKLKKDLNQAEQDFGVELGRLSQMLPQQTGAAPVDQTVGVTSETTCAQVAQQLVASNSAETYLATVARLLVAYAQVWRFPNIAEQRDAVTFHQAVAQELRKRLGVCREQNPVSGAGGLPPTHEPPVPVSEGSPASRELGPAAPDFKATGVCQPADQGQAAAPVSPSPIVEDPGTGPESQSIPNSTPGAPPGGGHTTANGPMPNGFAFRGMTLAEARRLGLVR